MRDGWIWDRLGIGRTEEAAGIRRAYARLLKAIDPEADPSAFIELRQARDAALAYAAGQAIETKPAPMPPPHASPPGAPQPSASPPPPLEAPPRPPSPPPERGPAPEPQAEPVPPPWRIIVAESALPELDQADLQRVEALLSAAEVPAWAELEGLTRKLLASRAAERIDIARWLETWVAERIAHFTPRSDPMIEPAVEHFRWDSGVADLNRPPIIDWILQRRIDRQFELELSAMPGGYSKLIRRLRKPLSRPPGPLVAWWHGVRVEFLIAYLQTYCPTVLHGLDSGTLAWWEKHIAAQAAAPRPIRGLRDWRRRRVLDGGMIGGNQPVPVLLIIGILLMPYIFAWFLLQRGYGAGVRLLAFGWLALIVLAVAVTPPPPPGQKLPMSVPPGQPPAAAGAADVHYLDMETDVAPIVAWASEGKLSLARIAGTEPALFRALADRWWQASANKEDAIRLRDAIGELLRKTYCEEVDSDAATEICSSVLATRAAAAVGGNASQ
jgi:hypothetical protein